MHVIGILLCARARMVPVCVYMTHLDRYAPTTEKNHLFLEPQFSPSESRARRSRLYQRTRWPGNLCVIVWCAINLLWSLVFVYRRCHRGVSSLKRCDRALLCARSRVSVALAAALLLVHD